MPEIAAEKFCPNASPLANVMIRIIVLASVGRAREWLRLLFTMTHFL